MPAKTNKKSSRAKKPAPQRDLKELERRIKRALDFAGNGAIDGAHHKMWTIDQMVRALTGAPAKRQRVGPKGKGGYFLLNQGESEEYLEWVKNQKKGEDGPETYSWDVGIPV